MTQDPLFIYVDLFCGFGGTTTGVVESQHEGNPLAKVIACVNHDPKAIKSHWQNHPDVVHFEEDIRTLDLRELVKICAYWQEVYPDAYLVLWASLECTNFSKAKGGQARDADSRTLADHLERYVTAINPDYVQIENVVEFMSWGPLDDKGKPVSRKSGEDWMRWRKEICDMGYSDQWRELNSANFGAYTSRNRLFGCFAKEGLPISWPEPTHSKTPSKFSMHGDLQKWNAVKEVLNFHDEGESIFTRKKPLSDKTLERIYAGLVKYVAKGDTSFLAKYFSGRPEGKVISTEGPAGTMTTVDSHTLVQTSFLSKYFSGSPADKNISVEGPASAITCRDHHAFVQPKFLLKYNSMSQSGKHIPPSVEDPCPTIPCQGRLGLVTGDFLQTYYGNGGTSSTDDPCPTLTTKDRAALVTPFIADTNFNNGPQSVENPLGTITASRRHHYIVNPSHGGHSTSTDAPCPVIIARQDKAPLYLVQVENGLCAIAVFDCDSEIMIRIKQFMCVYGLVDIKMRMLRVAELLKIQGFPADYKMVGNQSDHKKFIGNSVVPVVVKAWVEAMASRILETREQKVA